MSNINNRKVAPNNVNTDLFNEKIPFKEVLVIDANGDQLGVMSKRDALEKAYSQNLDLLDLGYDSISFIESNLSAIKEWLESDEFQNYYANVAYPPLLNPRTFDTTLPPEIAWDLNMPLHNYNFIWLYNSCCGGEATSLFFNHCGIDLVVFAWLGSDNAKDAYIRLYQKDKAYFSYTNIISNANKFACLLNKKTPIFYRSFLFSYSKNLRYHTVYYCYSML